MSSIVFLNEYFSFLSDEERPSVSAEHESWTGSGTVDGHAAPEPTADESADADAHVGWLPDVLIPHAGYAPGHDARWKPDDSHVHDDHPAAHWSSYASEQHDYDAHDG